tara:strand:+ start:797 stop:1186 length:390 start_codon:yes stop_codon:yes gene_type:complete
MDFLLTATPASAIALACFLALFGAGIVLIITSLAARSLPIRVQTRVDEIDQALSVIEQNTIELRNQWAITIEQLEALETSIEKKRRQTAASASRAERANAQAEAADETPQIATPEDQLVAIRQRIYGAG